MSNRLLHLLTIGLIFLFGIYLYNKYTFRENFQSKTRETLGKWRKLKRNTIKYRDNFIGSMVYKIKSSLRKAKL